MREALFGDTATLYSRIGDQYTRVVLRGVQWRQKVERINDNGRLTYQTATSVTVPELLTAEIKPGDVLVYGIAPNITAEYGIARLKAEYDTYCTVRAVADNRKRPKLKHRKVTAT